MVECWYGSKRRKPRLMGWLVVDNEGRIMYRRLWAREHFTVRP